MKWTRRSPTRRLIMESNPHFHDPGPKPTRYVGFSPGSWKPGLAWSEATTARHFPPPLPQRRQPGVEATGYSAAGARIRLGAPPTKSTPPPATTSTYGKTGSTALPYLPRARQY